MAAKGDSSLRFVPEILVDYINKFSRNDLEPASFFLHGVCLLVDISGFTKLSGEFCALGKSGVDDLQLATNGFMGRLVEIIYTFGGDIIKFAGDAIICVFSADFITSVSSKALRRSTCGFESYKIDLETFMNSSTNDIPLLNSVKHSRISPEVILRVMHCARVLRDIQTDKLTVHVAMSCGEMCFGILGGFENRWECLISGPCIHQLSDCLDDAPSKHAVISAECAQVLKEAINVNAVPFSDEKEDDLLVNKILTNAGMYEFEILPLESGNFRIVEVKCANNMDALAGAISKASTKAKIGANDHLKLIRQFVPVPVAEELDSATNLNYMAEIREVTTMFMKWDSYDADGKHRDLLGLQSCFYEAQRILQSTGAYLRQFLVDDKGCVLIACWGMPHLSYLDNAYRAVSSAAQIKYELNKLGMNCSFGITTGDVYCGTVGSALRMEYAAIGSVVNMSARLMCKANGEVYIDDPTHDRLPSSLLRTFIMLPLMQVKGNDGLLKVFKYVGSSIGVEDKAVGDHEISIVCRNTLTALLVKLAPATTIQTIKSNDLVSPRSDRRRMSWFPRMSKPTETQAAAPATLPIVLIQGKEGSGRTTVVSWLKAQAAEYALNACCVRLTKKDTQQEYGMWRKIFALLMPKDLFLNNNIQRQHVHQLLRKAYNGNPKLARTQGFPVLKAVLGITCDFVDEDKVMKPIMKHDSSMLSTSVRNLMSFKVKPAGSSRSRIVQFADCLMRVFVYLLSSQPTLVVVENIELADDESLQLLVDLTKISTRSGFVCTALVDPDFRESTSGKTKDATLLHSNAFNSSPWCKMFKQTLLSLPVTTNLTLENYTAEEIDRMLCVALGLKVVPPEISQLVQDFSGGSYFWVREIIQFLKEHGTDLFMSAIGEEKDDASCAGFESVRPAKRRGSMGVPGVLMKATPSFKAGGISSGRNNVVVAPHQQQLNKLVLTRFGNMSSENQRVLRTASIIGMTFTEDVLLGLLPEHLKLRFADCMSTLSQQKWVYQDSENASLYHFAHLHSHQIIYQLTPSSERNNLHQLIANYIAAHYRNDPSQYAPMCYHLMHCDTDEALQYAVKATSFLLDTDDIFDFGDCLDLLTGLIDCCHSPYDVEVLQHLLNQARDTIEALDVSTKSSPTAGFLRFLSCLGSGKGNGSSASVSPSKHSQETVKSQNNENNGAAYTHMTEGEDGEETHPDEGVEVNYEQRTKRLLLTQIHEHRASLCEKHVELSEEATKHVPKDWQRAFLRI